jgi:hypothetical protein
LQNNLCAHFLPNRSAAILQKLFPNLCNV